MRSSVNHAAALADLPDDATEPVRLRHRILRAGGWAGGGFVFDKLMAAGQLMVIARILTPGDFGLMAASAAVLLAALTVSELGLESALIAKGEVNDDDLAVAWSLTFGRGVLMAAAVWAGAGWVGEVMQMPLLASLLRVHAWALILQGAQSPMMALCVKHLDLRKRVTLDVVRRAVEAAVTITLALLYRTVWALVIGQLTALAIGCLLSFWMAPFRPRWSWCRSSVSYFLQYGKHLNVTTLCAFGVMTGGELIIGRLLGQEALGFYQVALAIPLLIGARATALMQQISVPTYAKLQEDRRGILRVFDLQMGLVGVLYLPLAAAVAVAAPLLVPLLLGPQWASIIEALRIGCLYAVCAGYSSVMTALHYGVGRPDLQTNSWAGQGLLYLVLVVPLVLYGGVSGAVLALAGSYVFGVLLQALWTRRLLGAAADGIFRSVGRAGAVAGVLTGMVLVTTTFDVPTSALRWPIILSAAVACYAWFVWSIEVPRLRLLWAHRDQVIG